MGTHGGGGSRPSADETRQALRWLGAPPTLLALAVLALNDHVLKQAAPSVVTGKLSDVAGLVVAPPLLAVGLALLRVPRPAGVSLVATGVGFVLVKTTEGGVDAANALWSLLWPTRILRDPTDLVALPALLLAAWVAGALRRPTSPGRHSLGLALGSLALPFAVVATAATSPCYTPEGLRDVGVVRGDFSGPPAGAENRLVVSLSYRSVSIDADGRLGRLSGVDQARVSDLGPPLEEACSTAQPQHCWRRTPGTREPWVEATTDGGTTWTTDYRMPAAELEQVRQEGGDTCDDEPLPVAPRDISVLDTPRGPVVAVASGRAGLLLRDGDGTWTRQTDDDISRTAGTPPTPDPDELFTPLDPTPTPTRPSRTTPAQPTPPVRSTTPCATRTVVTITPHPSNGTPFPRETCLTSPYN
ncbi:hypothetical protein P0Y31_15520 [Knoellia sp. 3-2P3]|uniref:hypothetical protein n=1 Tax=unclassified Knoellia TaxID=2618719 RepID=UPI0023DB104D|nr:hypothetical protein [Knoellia sp. 3-2P3]MDF2093759.1 hypothetical protein [Knoellia sp. 3-2P3]